MPSAETLRRRIHVLDRAQSDLLQHQRQNSGGKEACSPPQVPMISTGSDQSITGAHRVQSPMQEEASNASEYEDVEDTSESDVAGPPKRPSVSRGRRVSVESPPRSPSAERPRMSTRRKSSYHEPPSSRSWYHFDTAVLLALVSPIGNWLTGGELVANALMVLFLLFYLHQIIEVPWSLYKSSLPRRPESSSAHTPNSSLNTELRTIELSFFALSLISPLIGAELIHILLGDSISWFSTVLFVLATGIRPWTHLFDRLSSRIHNLHTQIHYPPSSQVENEELRDELFDLRSELKQLRDEILNCEHRVDAKLDQWEEEMYEYVEESLENVARKQDKRVKDVEGAMMYLQQGHHRKRNGASHAQRKSSVPPLLSAVKAIQSKIDFVWLWVFSLLPLWLSALLPSPPSPSNGLAQQSQTQSQHSPRHSLSHPKFSSGSSVSSLATIPEDEDSEEDPPELLRRSKTTFALPTKRKSTGTVKSVESTGTVSSVGGKLGWKVVYLVTTPMRLLFKQAG